ncbi:MAG: hypothetical protein P4L83_09205, partial [Nevskia sp.]|nr:hypothetical protein [Nevskia sp.]
MSKTSATLTSGTTVDSGGLLTVSSTAQTSGKANADGSQTGNTAVGVGAAVALNLGIASNTATIPTNTTVSSQGLTVSAMMPGTSSVNAFEADAKSGAGASNVGVAGSLALNTVDNSSSASLASGSTVDAGTGPVLIEASNIASNTVTSGASVTGSGTSAKVGVGASVGLNVAVDSTTAEVADGAILTGGSSMGLNATGGDTMATTVTGGAAGAQVTVTPLVAVSVAVDSTTALLGTGADVSLAGPYSSTASQNASVTTTATGTTQGSNVAVGA